MPLKYMNTAYQVVRRAFDRPGRSYMQVRGLGADESAGATAYEIEQFVPILFGNGGLYVLSREFLALRDHGLAINAYRVQVKPFSPRYARRIVTIDTYLKDRYTGKHVGLTGRERIYMWPSWKDGSVVCAGLIGSEFDVYSPGPDGAWVRQPRPSIWSDPDLDWLAV